MATQRLPRNAGLDAARAWAVMAMVAGHTTDALLSPAHRDTALFITYSTFRGMTAPLFLFVSGWAVMTRALRLEQSGQALLTRHLTRAALLFSLATLLRWPAWDLPGLWSGRESVWRHLFGMDALSCIALCLGLSGLLLLLPLGRAARATLCAGLALGAPLAAGWAQSHPLPAPLSLWLVLSADSPFPVLPWGGFFFGGAALGVFVASVPSRSVQPLGLLTVGFLGVVGAELLGLDRLPLWSPILFAYRLGFAATVGGVALALPDGWLRWAAPVGRASLVTYVLHVPLLYGWGTDGGLRGRLGSTATPFQIVLLSVLLVALGTLLSSAWRRWRPSPSPKPTFSGSEVRLPGTLDPRVGRGG